MNSTELARVKKLVSTAAIYVQSGEEPFRINQYDDDSFFGYGTETDTRYRIRYEWVNLGTDLFYKLVLLNNNEQLTFARQSITSSYEVGLYARAPPGAN